MTTMNISLPAEMKEWVEAQAATGDFANSSDYIRDLIRHDKERRQAIVELQAAVDEAIDSGEGARWDRNAFLKKMKPENVAG